MIIAFILCSVVAFIAYLIKVLYFPVLYPVKSSSNELTLVLYGGFHPNKPVIILRHYVDERHIADYELEIINGIRIQEPQSYGLPHFSEGTVEVIVELSDETNSRIEVIYSSARDLYANGLLIYLYTDFKNFFVDENRYIFNQYIHFVSGSDTITYFLSGENRAYYLKNASSPEWSMVVDSPRRRRIPRNETPFLIWYSEWRENEWIRRPGSN